MPYTFAFAFFGSQGCNKDIFSHNSGESVMVVMHVWTHAKSNNSLSEREEVKQNPTAQNTQKWNTDKLLHSENGNFGLISHR